MPEYITKEQAWEVVKIVARHGGVDSIINADKRLAAMPPADVAPVVHAQWERFRCTETETGFIDFFLLACSSCGKQVADETDYKYCPNCGARMDGEER